MEEKKERAEEKEYDDEVNNWEMGLKQSLRQLLWKLHLFRAVKSWDGVNKCSFYLGNFFDDLLGNLGH